MLQLESTMARMAFKRMTGNKKSVMLLVFHNPLCERTGSGWIWGRAITRIRAAVCHGLGIRCNIWARALQQREITHHLRGGNNNIGWGMLRWQEMVGTNEVRFSKHRELRFLPKKIANFHHEL